MTAALEVLVELAARRVERRAQDTEAVAARERLRRLLRLGVERDPAEPARRRGDEQRPERRLDHVVGAVEQARGSPGGAEPAVEFGRDAHRSSFRRNRRTPDEAAWRAASSLEPSAAPIWA